MTGVGVKVGYDVVLDIAFYVDEKAGIAFGPIWHGDGGTERAEAFMASLSLDIREYHSELLEELRNLWTMNNPRREELVDA